MTKFPQCVSCNNPAYEYCEVSEEVFVHKEKIDKDYGYKKKVKEHFGTCIIRMFKCMDCWLKVCGKTKNDDTIVHWKEGKPYAIFKGDCIKGVSGKLYPV